MIRNTTDMRLPTLALTLWLAALPAASVAAETALETGQAFCKTRLASDDAALRMLLSPSLVKIVEEAERRNAIIAEARPGEKPPFGDGLPYQSFQDHAPGCTPGTVEEDANGAEIEIRYSFPESLNSNWTDRLVLLPKADGYRIDDILFANVANSTSEMGLRRVLFEAFDQ